VQTFKSLIKYLYLQMQDNNADSQLNFYLEQVNQLIELVHDKKVI